MASKLTQLQSKATQASQLVAKHGCAYYKQLLEQNKQYIQEPPTVEKCSLLSKQLFYTRLARSVNCLIFNRIQALIDQQNGVNSIHQHLEKISCLDYIFKNKNQLDENNKMKVLRKQGQVFWFGNSGANLYYLRTYMLMFVTRV